MSEAWHVEREGVACGKTCLEDRNNFSTVWNNSSGKMLRNSGATGSLSSIVDRRPLYGHFWGTDFTISLSEELPSITKKIQQQTEADQTDIKKLKHAQQQLDLTNVYPGRKGGHPVK